MSMDREVVSSSAQGPSSEETRAQMLEMENLVSNPELSRLYRILDRELRNVRLERSDNIHMVHLYKENRAERDLLEESFDPIGQDVNDAVGYWCYTRLFYDERGTAIRQVPVGRGSWKLCKTKPTVSRDGETWCRRKLTYDNFKMLQYSLGREGDKPEYAICQISRINKGAPNPPRPQQPARPPGGSTAGELNEIDQGSPSGTNYNNAFGEPEAPLPSVTVPPSQNYNEYAKQNKRRRYEIEDPSERSKWPIENEDIAEILIMAGNLLRSRSTLQIRDPSDKSEWTIENAKITEALKMFTSALDQSMHEIPQPNAAPPYMRIENVPSTSRVQPSQHGAAGTSNESALYQDQNLSHQSYMSTQEGLQHPEVQQGLSSKDMIECQFDQFLESLDMKDDQPTIQFQAPQHGAAGTSNESARHQDPNLSHQSYMPTQEGLHDYQRSVISGTTLHPQVQQRLLSNNTLEQHVELPNMGIEYNQPTMQFQTPQHGAAGIVNDSAMPQDQNLSHQPHGMANQWNAHVIDPIYPPGESSTPYNQEFNDDDVNTSEPDFDG